MMAELFNAEMGVDFKMFQKACAAGDKDVPRFLIITTLRFTTGDVRGILTTSGLSLSPHVVEGKMAQPTPAATKLMAVAWCCTSYEPCRLMPFLASW